MKQTKKPLGKWIEKGGFSPRTYLQLEDGRIAVQIYHPHIEDLFSVHNLLDKDFPVSYFMDLEKAKRWAEQIVENKLWTAATDLYTAADWSSNGQLSPEREAVLWARLRDALGLEKGTATELGVGAGQGGNRPVNFGAVKTHEFDRSCTRGDPNGGLAGSAPLAKNKNSQRNF